MKLDLTGIGCIRIGGRYYGHRAISVNNGGFRVYANWRDYAIVPIDAPDAPCLDIGGRVWLGVAAFDAGDGTFAPGGYLETQNVSYAFLRDGATAAAVVTVELLGLTPSPYNGGVRIDGLELPASMRNNTPAGGSGSREVQMTGNAPIPQFAINGVGRSLQAVRFVSYRQSASRTYTTDATIPTVFCNNLRTESLV